MANRSYRQYCALARALDLVGERWSLLLIRELMTGPKRYKELLESLQGIGTNLLAKRLRDLETADVIERISLPPPAASTVYGLTARGRELEPVVLDLVRWGFGLLDERRPDEISRPHWDIVAMKAAFLPEAARGVDETYEIRIDDSTFHVTVAGGETHIGTGPANSPALTLTTDAETFSALGLERLDPGAAIETGRLTVDGPVAVLRRLFRMFRTRVT